MIDLPPALARDAPIAQLSSDFPGAVEQAVDVVFTKPQAVILAQKEPVASPGHVSRQAAVTVQIQGYSLCPSIAGYVFNHHFTRLLQAGGDGSRGGFQAMPAGLDATQVAQGGDNSDGAVTAHPQVADVIEEDHSGGAVRLAGLTEKGSDQRIGAAWLVHDRRAKGIETLAKAKQSFGQGTGAEIGSSRHHHPCRFTGGMGVNDADSFHGSPRGKGGDSEATTPSTPPPTAPGRS